MRHHGASNKYWSVVNDFSISTISRVQSFD